jgi:hypothetical protein
MPDKEPMITLQIRLSGELVDRIDRLRLGMSMRPSRVQTIRWILENGINILESSREVDGEIR